MIQKTFSLLVLILLINGTAQAASFLVVEGHLLDSGGLQPIEAPSVTFTLNVLSPGAESCLLYRETHTVNMSGTRGYFNLNLGQGSRSGGGFADTSSLSQALSNDATPLAGLTCASGSTYTSAFGDHRNLRLSYNDGVNGLQTLSQDIQIGASGYALSAQSIDGINSADLLVQRDDGGHDLNQANLENIFTTANYTELLALLSGSSTQYLSGLPATNFDMNSNQIVNLIDPTNPNDAANKNYVDSNIGGAVADPSLASLSVGNAGDVLTWNGTQWTATSPRC